MIEKEGGKYVLRSKKTGRRLSKPGSKKAALKRERQVEWFKHHSGRGGSRTMRQG